MSGSRAARKEVSEWLKGQASEAGDEVARLEIHHVKESERCIVLKTAKGEAFSITYQTDYPSSSDEYLFLETESKVVDFVAVINDLRDFVYGQPPSLTLSALLDQLKRYLMKKAQKAKGGGVPGPSRGGGARGKAGMDDLSGGDEGGWSDEGGEGGAGSELFSNDQEGEGSGGGDDHDNDYADEDENNGADDADVDEDEGNESDYVYEEDDDEAVGGGTGGSEAIVGQVGSTWLDEHYKKRTWQSKERELRKEMAANKERKAKEDANKGGGKKKVENIFTSWASSAVLTQDLLDIQRLEHELGMEVEAVEDNIFHWKVKINKVSESSPLAEDLRMLRKTYAYGYVEMELTFTMDLYPFYPPLVKLVRPRFQGFMMGRITSLEMLQLSKWSSVRGMKGVLIGIRTALETWGRLDLDSELNDMIVHPEGSYTELEHLLMRLGLVTEIRPHDSEAFDEDALWEAVDMREEAQEKAHRLGSSTSNHARQSSEGSSVERKRKRSGPAAAAAAAKDSAPSSSSADAAAKEDGRGNPESVVVQGKGVKGEAVAVVAAAAGEGGEDALNGASQGEKTGINVAQKIWSEVKGQKATSATASAPLAKDSAKLLDSLLEDLRTAATTYAASTATTAKAGANAQDGSGADMKGLTSTKKRQQYWAAGTGYGHSGAAGEKWDVEAYLAAQREQDRLKEDLLQEIAYLMRPDERHTFPEHVTCDSSNNSISGLDEDSWSRTSPPNATVSDVAPHSDPRKEGRNGFGGDARGKGRGKGKEKVTATEDVPAPGAGFNAVSAAAAASPASTRGLATEIYDLSGRRRKKLMYSQEIYRVETVKSSLRVLEESCLVPFLQQLLENDSLLDVDRHASLYTSVFKLVRCITAWQSLHPLLCPMKGQPPGKSIYRLLSRLGDRAKVYRSTTAKGTSGRKSATPQQNAVNTSTKKGWRRGGTSGRGTSGTGTGEGSTSSAGEGTKEDDHSALTDLLLSAVREVEEVVDASFVEELERASITRPAEASSASRSSGKMVASTGVVGGSSKGRGRAGRSRGGGGCSREEGRGVRGGIDGDEAARRYRESMAPLQYVELEDLEGFHYKSESANTMNRGNSQRVKRLGQEHADLSQSLPLSLSSSVFVRTHEDQMDWMQVMISGPDDTPYSGGLFAFDIFFPQNYPQCPPKVKLVTTGGGQHRFNPNLYADGKVCLSLLGTWDGDRGESWNSHTSTLLQVLVSIQSLILVPEPFFNEPGYERQLGTETGKSQSWDYNARQREGTLRLAMLDMIQRPPKGFEEVVNRHFYLRRSYLEGLLHIYVKEAKEKEKKDSKRVSGGHLSRLQGLASKLKEKLASIPPPPPV